MSAFRAGTGNSFVVAAARVLTAAGLALLVAACASNPVPPAPRDLAGAGGFEYRIGPLDIVNVIVWRNPELSLSVPVRPDGRISTPLVEDVVAIGRTPTELARDLEKSLVKFVREPVVTVIVTNFAGPVSAQVRVVGEAAKPQAIAYREDMSVLDVMIAAGGLTDFADGNDARIFRPAEGGKLYAVRLHDLLKRGDISANVAMRPGDILIIPQSWF